ncbi:hypothetical protein TWF506_010649 [Arthrobotrys conoides]|uniref:Uncharacterized protein n=1 Tax=Arthrobotrys conoides TaxID=74498 RepID=A0AAN8NF99_9PEZI
MQMESFGTAARSDRRTRCQSKNGEDQGFFWCNPGDFGLGVVDTADPSPRTQATQDSNPQLEAGQPPQLRLLAADPTPAPAPAPAILVQASDDMASADEWENSNPRNRFDPEDEHFNFSPIVPQGTSNHPESVKRRRIIGKKAGLVAALFRLKESGRSRKRHRKVRVKQVYEGAGKAILDKMLAKEEKRCEKELAVKIAGCTRVWNKLSPEDQRAFMTGKPVPDANVVAAPQVVAAEVIRPPITVRIGATNAPKRAKVGGLRVVTVELTTNSRGPQLRLPVDTRDVEPRIVALARTKATPFASAAAGQNWSAVEGTYALRQVGSNATVDTVAPISSSRAVACANEIPVEAPLPRKRKRDAETVESQTPGRSCQPHTAPTLSEKRAANAIRYIMRLMAGQAGTTGTVIPPGPLEQLGEEDLNARAERDAAHFMMHQAYKRWLQGQKNKKQ